MDLNLHFEELHTAIVKSFKRPELQRLVRFRLGITWDNVVPRGDFEDEVFKLLEWANGKSLLRELFDAVCEARPRATTFKNIAIELRDSVKDKHEAVATQLERLTPCQDDIREELLANVPHWGGIEQAAITDGSVHNGSRSDFIYEYHRAKAYICAIGTEDSHVGTGFLIAQNLILTNWHVFEACLSRGTEILAVFDHFGRSDFEELTRYHVAREPLAASDQLDFAIVQLLTAPANNRGCVALTPPIRKLDFREPVFVIGHPGTTADSRVAPAPLTLSVGVLFDANSESRRIAYSAQTAPGSSGSPVFNENFEVIGIHYHGEKRINNHGIPIWAIIEELKSIGKSDIIFTEPLDAISSRPGEERPLASSQSNAISEEKPYLTSLAKNLETNQGNYGFDYVFRTTLAPTLETKPAQGLPRSLHDLVNSNYETTLEDIKTLQQFRQFVLLGDPGGGKTTTLRFLAQVATRRRSESSVEHPFPIYLSLRGWQEMGDIDFLEFVNTSLGPSSFEIAKANLDICNAILFLDGVDEMGPNSERLASKLKAWISEYNGPVVVTCRTQNYVGERLRLDIPTATLCELSDEEVCRFAKSYLGEKATEFLELLGFRSTDGEYEGLTGDPDNPESLYKNPYLLVALFILFTESSKEGLPKQEVELTPALIRALWKREKGKGTAGWIPLNEMIEALGRLGYAMVDEDQQQANRVWAYRHLLNKSWLTPLTDEDREAASAMLHAFASADLLELSRGEDSEPSRIQFRHQLLRDYFAAEGLARRSWRAMKDGIDTYISAEDDELIYGRYLSKWDQVVMALCGVPHVDPDAVVEHALDDDPRLAALCIGNGAKVSDVVRNKVINRLLQAIVTPGAADYSWTGAHARDELVSKLVNSAATEQDAIDLLRKTPTLQNWIQLEASKSVAYLGKPAIGKLLERAEGWGYEVAYYVTLALIYIGVPAVEPLLEILKSRRSALYQSLLVSVLRSVASLQPVYFKQLPKLKSDEKAATGDDEGSWLDRAFLKMALGENVEALADYERSAERDPDNAWLHVLRSDHLRLMQRDDEALAAYRRAVEMNPEDIWTLHRLIETLDEKEDTKLLLELYGKRTAMDVNIPPEDALADAHVHSIAGDRLSRRGETQVADKAYEKAAAAIRCWLTSQKQDIDECIHLARCMRQLKRPDEYYSLLLMGLEVRPWHNPLLSELASMLSDVGEYERSAKLFYLVLALDPVDVDAMSRLSWSLRHANPSDYETVRHIAEQTSKLASKEDTWIHKEIGDAYRMVGDQKGADSAYGTALGGAKEPSVSGWCNLMLGRMASAESDFQQALKEDGSDHASRLDLALTQLLQGRKDIANMTYREAIDRLDGEHPALQRKWFHVGQFDILSTVNDDRYPVKATDALPALELLKSNYQKAMAAIHLDYSPVDRLLKRNPLS